MLEERLFTCYLIQGISESKEKGDKKDVTLRDSLIINILEYF